MLFALNVSKAQGIVEEEEGCNCSGAGPKQRNPTAVGLSEKGLRVVACSLRLTMCAA